MHSNKLVKYNLSSIIVVIIKDGNLKQNRNGKIEKQILSSHSTTDLWIVRNTFWIDCGGPVIQGPQGPQQATSPRGKTGAVKRQQQSL